MEIDSAFGNWLSGFIDGEGCFIIRETMPNQIYCGFSIEVRLDDAEIIRDIHKRTGAGTLKMRHRSGKNGNDCPQIGWYIQDTEGCVTLAEILEQHPLRAKKRRDYAIWFMALNSQAAHFRSPNEEHIDQMRYYKEALSAVKQYAL